MQASDIPGRVPLPFAESGIRSTIPVIPSGVPGRASLQEGFPGETMQPIAVGGIPPAGQDFNGILYAISAWARWQGAGGPVSYDAGFATAIGGYPKGAVVAGAVAGRSWVSLIDNNTTNPDAGGAGWLTYSSGRLLNTQTFVANGTYTPTPGARYIEVEGCGGGGGGGYSAATGASDFAIGSGGAYASFARATYLLSALTATVPVTIGAAGVSGLAGTATSFGSYLTLPGGLQGGSAGPAALGFFSSQGIPGALPTGIGIILRSRGAPGQSGAALGGYLVSGQGGSGPYGGGGVNQNAGAGSPGSGYGAGGGGAGSNPSYSAQFGGAGTGGILIIREYA